jgi:hypothetical protein
LNGIESCTNNVCALYTVKVGWPEEAIFWTAHPGYFQAESGQGPVYPGNVTEDSETFLAGITECAEACEYDSQGNTVAAAFGSFYSGNISTCITLTAQANVAFASVTMTVMNPGSWASFTNDYYAGPNSENLYLLLSNKVARSAPFADTVILPDGTAWLKSQVYSALQTGGLQESIGVTSIVPFTSTPQVILCPPPSITQLPSSTDGRFIGRNDTGLAVDLAYWAVGSSGQCLAMKMGMAAGETVTYQMPPLPSQVPASYGFVVGSAQAMTFSAIRVQDLSALWNVNRWFEQYLLCSSMGETSNW